ncbi:hypothetical protein NB706_002901 [Xanthomonas sacchari]|nr:hypothetical protein [Xanthomonas sacchari]
MADGDEEAVRLQVAGAAVLHRLDPHAGDAGLVAQHLVHLVMPDGLDLAGGDLGEQLVLHDLFRAQGVAAVHQIDLAGDVGQVQRLFHGGVAAADHDHVLVLVEEAVAGGAGGHAAALERLFRGNAQVLGGGAGGDDQRVAGVVAAVAAEPERALRQVGGVDVVEDHLGLEALGMRLHARHQVRAHQAVGVAGPVVDLRGGHQLAALLQAGDHHRLEIGARGVDRGGPAGRAGTQDQQAGMLGGIGGRGAHVYSRTG